MDRFFTYGASIGENNRYLGPVTQMWYGAYDIGYDLPGSLDDDAIAYSDVFFGYKVWIVERNSSDSNS